LRDTVLEAPGALAIATSTLLQANLQDAAALKLRDALRAMTDGAVQDRNTPHERKTQ